MAVERLWPGRKASIAALSGGITNRNYRVDVDGASFVLRVGGNDTALLGIDRPTEHAASLRAAEVGVGPAVFAFVEPEGWLVTRFIDGRGVPPEEIRTPEGIRRVAAVLRKIHGATEIPGWFDAHAIVDEYRDEAVAHGVSIPREFADAHRASERIRIARGPQREVPCHNDLLNANFLDDGELRIGGNRVRGAWTFEHHGVAVTGTFSGDGSTINGEFKGAFDGGGLRLEGTWMHVGTPAAIKAAEVAISESVA